VGCGQSAEDLRLELDDAKVSEDIMVQTETDEKIAEEQQADKQDVVEEKDQMEDERPASQVRRFDMTAKQWEFEPAVIEVYEGDTVQVNVTSIDVAHGFAIKEYDIDDIIDAIRKDEKSEQTVRDAAENRFLTTKEWGVFSKDGTPLKDLAIGGQVTVLDVSCYATMPGGWKIKSLIVGLVGKKLFIERMKARKTEEHTLLKESTRYFSKEERDKIKIQTPLLWIMIDEAHEFLPLKGKTAASDALITILREGRQPGVSLILASQQPGKIHTDVMTQSDTVIAHRLTAKVDIDALGKLMQSYMRHGLDEELNKLPRLKGAAIIFDDMNEKLYPMQMRPRFTWHGGEAPIAIEKEEKKFEFSFLFILTFSFA